jgi:outer membrane lipoprotein SlyB
MHSMNTKNLSTTATQVARKKLQAFTLATLLSVCAGQSMASEVIRAVDDNTAGQTFGGLSGLLLGAAAGGPVGALVGGLAGIWIGAESQQASGLSEQAYMVKTATGEELTVRSPKRTFNPGEQVVVQGNRLHSAQ